jgi:phage shock protein PspC (stress-responsive transcriptional regulator)
MNEHPDAPPSPAGDLPPVSEPASEPTGGTGGPSPTPPPPSGSGPDPAGPPFAARYGLVRPLQGRYLGGVCAAIGRATNTDPVLWRVVLAVTSFVGVGLLIYLVGWLLIPAEGDTASPVEALVGRGRSRTSPVIAVLLGALAVLVLGGMLNDGFRGPLLVVGVVLGAVLLLNRNNERRQEATTGYQAPYASPAPFPPGTPYSSSTVEDSVPPVTPAAPYAAAYRPAAAPYAAPAVAPGAPLSTAAGPTAPPPAPPGYQPPFAPHGPYAAGPGYPPASQSDQRPPAYPPQPPRPPKPPRERSRLGIFTLSLVLVALGTVAALDMADIVQVNVAGYFAAMLAMVGLGLVVGAWFGRARWLIAVGLVFAVALGIASAAERIDTRNFGSDLVWRPASAAALDDGYEQSFGSAKLDLRQVDFTGQTKAVSVRINAGDLEVMLPPTVDAQVRLDINAGDGTVFGTNWSGLRSSPHEVSDLGPDGAGGGNLRLSIHVNAGSVEVHR